MAMDVAVAAFAKELSENLEAVNGLRIGTILRTVNNDTDRPYWHGSCHFEPRRV
jgi:hypothetical protein